MQRCFRSLMFRTTKRAELSFHAVILQAIILFYHAFSNRCKQVFAIVERSPCGRFSLKRTWIALSGFQRPLIIRDGACAEEQQRAEDWNEMTGHAMDAQEALVPALEGQGGLWNTVKGKSWAAIKKTTDLMKVYKPCVSMLKDMKALVELDMWFIRDGFNKSTECGGCFQDLHM